MAKPSIYDHQLTSEEQYREAYSKSVSEPEAFWGEIAETFEWREPYEKVLSWDFDTPDVRWFEGGKLNITENCLDRHIEAGQGSQTAIIWEPNEPGNPRVDGNRPGTRHISYRQLHQEVCRAANGLKALGIEKGDRVIFYMPMVPELAVGVLACARIGAVHSVVFAGFSAKALADRINDASAKLVVCSDFNRRGSKVIPVKAVVDDALALGCPSIEANLVHRNTADDVTWNEGIDVWWHDQVDDQSADCPAEAMDAEDLLFILYTSGSTGKPKGVVHTCGGYMVYTAYTFVNVFGYKPGDVYWCTADIGWITGHSYIVYGPLAAGATTVMFEGVPTYPDAGRFWQICEKLEVNQFYTAPTAIRALMAHGTEPVDRYDLSQLRVLGTVGEPINEEAWEWYDEHVGKTKCPIVDTWWQTETGGILITTLPGVLSQKPTFAGYPMPGVQPVLLNADGEALPSGEDAGRLGIKFPWPSILRTTYGDHERCRNTYFSTYPNYYFTGDGARRDAEGRYRIVGRIDDVINVSGHRLGTAEIENAVNEVDEVVESAVVGYPHPIKGQGIYAFVKPLGVLPQDELRAKIVASVRDIIGPIAKPDQILVVDDLPKTRSGKIMRRILRKLAAGEGDQLGDVSTLLNPEVVEAIKGKVGS